MTSHDVPEGRFTDLLDVMIQWVLHESVADAAPPPATWERIRERLVKRAGVERAGWWREFRRAVGGTVLWLLESFASPSVGFDCCYDGAPGEMRESYLWLLVYQCDLATFRAQAV
ncbi:MAG: hypothetical protein U9R72_07150 [Chloroflexota bacterium]|nr:hypothetical protein [Chloroflexota bacterium]